MDCESVVFSNPKHAIGLRVIVCRPLTPKLTGWYQPLAQWYFEFSISFANEGTGLAPGGEHTACCGDLLVTSETFGSAAE